ncbi:MAG: hypothetical protein RIR51_894 [Bacteroidota bacterium]
MKKQLIILILVLIGTNISLAQNGTIRGKVLEGTTGEGAIAATVQITGGTTNLGAFTDLDGSYTFNVPAGTYDIEVTYIGFNNTKITGIEVGADKVIVVPDISLAEATTQLKEVVVTAKLLKTSEEAITIMKRKSPAMMDGISAAKMKLIGDATAVEAAKRVTGVSIEGGKYVYVRGLGDRYSKTTLNGLDIPGLDPDRNSLQMDIFPTALVDNITVSKNFLPDMPADFTGGLLNISTKDFPDNKIFNVSASVGYNPSMHFNNDYLVGNKGKLDWLGMDDGSRALPELASQGNIPTPSGGTPTADVTNFVNSFNPNLAALNKKSFMDYSLGFSYGNQIDLNKDGSRRSNPKLGYILAASYKFDQKYYNDIFYGEYQKNFLQSETQFVEANTVSGRLGEENVLLGTLGGVAFKTNFSKIKFNAMRLQSGESKAGKFLINNNSDAVGQSGYVASSDNLEYSERSVTNYQLSGSHVIDKRRWNIEWAAGNTISVANDPDIRKTAFTLTQYINKFNAGAGGNPSRIWRNLNEMNTSFKIDFEKKFNYFNSTNTLKFGALYVTKTRDYEIKSVNMQFYGNQVWNTTNANDVLTSANIYPNGNRIYYSSGITIPNSNQYNSTINNLGFYVMNDMDLSKKLKAIIGLRAEQYSQFHTGRDQRFAAGNTKDGKNLVNAKVLDQLNLFPSVNLIQKIADKTNLRGSYTKTTARPSFKELSFAQIIDPMTNRIFNGSLFEYGNWNGNLIPTMIDNVDLRWEKFFAGSEILSVSGFYKQFQNPIELVRIPEQQTSTEYQPRNVGNGKLYGLEFELNKSLSFISPILSKFNFNTNVTIVKSEITMSTTEYNARASFVKVGETLKKTRPMAGQSPYIVNAGLNYADFEKGLNIGLYYNVKGPTLSIVGSGLFPDIYSLPYNNLSFSYNKSFGKEQKLNLNFRVENILNDNIEVVYRAYNADDKLFSIYQPKRSFSLGLSYRL